MTTPTRTCRTWTRAIAGTALCALSGSIATDPDSPWYRSLDKPSWQPPPVAFPLVWTGLYCSLAATCARAITALDAEDRGAEARGLERALLANLVLNQAWSWTFFRSHRLTAATLNAAALAASSADLARRAGRADRRRALELVPYTAWCSFATALTAAIARRNRR
ncbi:TspO/MBR family protein [Brachybacterium nesterenkovii]|uniref:Tryptophan-rich sensory protein n=1 Tax=Brachybacterium nesterenkovii TaxID=47847 RepID=A0A1X6X856_9MICO|nr:TspO/MBR family protein [Brachybacterium nesterenkovii]SLM95319.1 Tryptophan-rich sensory protein [Brachybacterium nesterenkovii]